MKEVFVCFDLTDGHLLDITTDNTSANYLIMRELQSTLEAARIKWPTMRNGIPCMHMSFRLLWVRS